MNCVFELSLLVIRDHPKRYPYNVMVWQRAIFCTYDDADTYIRDNIEDWHLKIHPSTSKRFRKIYEANLLNDYKT